MTTLSQLFPCFGLSAFGMCSYNPAQPTPTYFTLGNAIAALGFTLAIQQLFKPIYLFRLRAYGLRIIYLSAAVFAGAVCAIVAMVLPNLPISHEGPLEYPIVWELVGGLLIGIAYGVAAFISLRPARINAFNLFPFVRAALALLSAASDDDRVSFAEDLLRGGNIERLVNYALAWRHAEMHGAHVEFDRLRAIGAPLQITGPPPISAFYLFAHRRELEAAYHAGTLLQVMSDPGFCSALVRKCSWLTAATLDAITKKRLHSDQAEQFVQEIAHQAILHDESMLAREVSYTGFGTLPVLSRSLFGSWFILSHYNPLGGMSFNVSDNPSQGYVARLNGASKMMLETAIRGGDYWPQRYMHSARSIYESLCRQWSYARPGKQSVGYTVTLHMGISQLYKITLKGLDNLQWDRKKSLFIIDPKRFRTDLVDSIASIVYESLACIANDFTGVDDSAWVHAISVFLDIYPPHDTEPLGMNPLQQQLAVQLIDKLRHNMEGFYPAISRILLAVIGPYAGHPQITKRTAHVILKDAVYKELQKLPTLYAKKSDKISDYFPTTVTYDPTDNTLTHAYRFGEPLVTNLSALEIPDIDLYNESNWQTP